MAGDLQHIHDPAKAEEFARAVGLQIGGAGHPFVGDWATKGLYAYRSGKYSGIAYFGTGGGERDRLAIPHESEKYRPWNRYDPDIPAHIREKLVELEDDDSTNIAQPPQPAPAQPSNQTLRMGWYRMEHGDGSFIERARVHRDARNTVATNEFIATGDLTGDVLWYVEGNTVIVPKHGSTGTIQADGNITWSPDGTKAVYEGNAGDSSTGNPSIRNDVGKIALKSVHGKYLSAQPDGRAEWNRAIANDWEFFELGERDGRKITLKSTHGKYVSAQPDGSVQINRDHAPPTGWEEFTVETRPSPTPGDAHDFLNLKSVHGKYLSAQPDGTAQWNRDRAPPGGWEDIQFVPYSTQNQESAPTQSHEPARSGREESIEILEAVAGKPIRFKINNRPSSNDAWVGIYPPHANDQDHGGQNNRWKWLRDIDGNYGWFPKQAVGSHSIRVFSDGGYTLHERKDFTVEAVPIDPVAVKSTRKKAWTALAIGLLLLAPGIPLFIMGLGGGFQYEAVSSGTFEIVDSDGQGDFGFEIFIEGVPGDFDGNGYHDYCENVVISANHTGGWFTTGPHGEIVAENPPDESREVFYKEIAGEGSDWGCVHHHHPEQASHNGVQLVKIGRACKDCMNGTTTITSQNQQGNEILMWIRTEENQEILGMLIPGAIMMGIGALTVIGSLGILAKTRGSNGRGQTTSADSSNIYGTSSNPENWFTELSKQSKEIEVQIASGEKLSNHDRVMEEMKFPDKVKVEFDIKQGSPLWKWCSHLFNDPAKSAIIARELGLQVGGAGYDFEGKWKDKGLFAYHTGKYAGCAYFGIGGTADEELEQKGGGEKYRPWEVNDPNMPNDIREAWRKIEPALARSYYLHPPN